MIRRPPRSTRTDTLFPTRRSSDLIAPQAEAVDRALDRPIAALRLRIMGAKEGVVGVIVIGGANVACRLRLAVHVENQSYRIAGGDQRQMNPFPERHHAARALHRLQPRTLAHPTPLHAPPLADPAT